MPVHMEQTGRESGGEVRVLRAPYMDKKEYVESFGWKMEKLAPQEIREVESELHTIEKGMTVMDGVLFWKITTITKESMQPCSGGNRDKKKYK